MASSTHLHGKLRGAYVGGRVTTAVYMLLLGCILGLQESFASQLQRHEKQSLSLSELYACHECLPAANSASGMMHMTHINGTAFAYLTHRIEQHYFEQTQLLTEAFGESLAVVTPSPLAGLPHARIMTDIPSVVPDEHWAQFTGVNESVPQGGILLGRTLMMMLADPKIEYLWIMENDVLIKEADHLRMLVESARSEDADYMPCNLIMWDERTRKGSHWDEVQGSFEKPWAKAFAPLMRISKRLVAALVEYDSQNGQLHFFESLLPTLALHRGMRIQPIDSKFVGGLPVGEQRWTSWHIRYRPCWNESEIEMASGPGLFFHPVKVVNGAFIAC